MIGRSTSAGFEKTEGSTGNYVVAPATGSLGVMSVEPSTGYSGSPSEHEQLVRGYYGSLSLPADQIEVASNSIVGGSVGPRWVQTTFTRFVASYHVSGSYVRAMCRDSSQCIDEAIFWPPVPGSVVQGADDFRSFLGTADGQKFRDRLPATARLGTVVIHHTEWKISPTIFTITYDVDDQGLTRSYDRDGNPVYF